MYKRITVLLLLLMTVFAQQAWAQMTDAQIIEYIVSSVAAGKTERQIANDLFAKGVSTVQIQQLMRQYRNGNGSSALNEKEKSSGVSSAQVSRNVASSAQEDNIGPVQQDKKKIQEWRKQNEPLRH